MLFLKQRTRLKQDAIIGLIFTSFFGLGLFMVSLSPTSVNIQTIVMGNILAIPSETLQLVIIAFVSLPILTCKWKDLMVVFFDETHARSIGLTPTALKIVFFALLAACTVAALQTVGAFLVIAMVVTPGATAYLLTDRFGRLCRAQRRDRRATGWSAPMSAISSTARPAASSSSLQTLVFLAAFVFAPKHGMLARAAGAAARTRPHDADRHLLPPSVRLHAARADRRRVLVAVADGAALLLSRPQGLVADGRRDLPRRAARAS